MTEQASPKKSLRILNTREKKELNQKIREQWGCDIDRSFVFLLSNKDRLYIADKDIGLVDFEKLKIDNLGLYICNVSEKGVRLTIEGSQLLGPEADKNVVEISDSEVKEWFRGNDLDKDTDQTGFVIVKNDKDFMGCGRSTGNKILNFVPKSRRILSRD